MSDITIKVSTEKMEETANIVDAKLKSINNSFSQIDIIVKKSTSYWEGDGADYFRNLYTKAKESIDEVLARLNEEVVDLGKMAGIYHQAEMQSSNTASALPSDVIS